MVRIMTWNCLSMNNVNKQNQLTAYIAARNIDYCFLQEGFAGNFGPRCVHAVENHNASNSLDLSAPANKAEEVLRAAYSGGTSITAVGGMATNDTYNVHYPVGVAPAINESDYMGNANVRIFLTKPAEFALTLPGTFKRPPAVKYLTEFKNNQYKFVYFGSVGGDITTDIKTPTNARLNLAGYRRPKSISATIGGNAWTIYFWHAPIGGNTTVADIRLSQTYGTIAQQNSGGQLAICANILFARFLGLTNASTDMPARTMLVGDLNIKPLAVSAIYGTNANVESSLDTLCHVIAPQAQALTRRLVADWAHQNNQYECTDATYPLLVSDHAPVIVDV